MYCDLNCGEDLASLFTALLAQAHPTMFYITLPNLPVDVVPAVLSSCVHAGAAHVYMHVFMHVHKPDLFAT